MLFAIEGDKLVKQDVASFGALNIRERTDLQRLLRAHPEALGEELKIVAEEFGDWADSRRRIDLLAIDRERRLVVIELKRTEDGGHMELQALRYAAMVSAMTFGEVVAAYARHRAATADAGDPRDELTAFLGGEDAGEEIAISSEARIILVAADFGIEITTTVLWLNNFDGLDIRCVRMAPYELNGDVYIDIRQVIPLPEARDYQVRLRKKEIARERSTIGSDRRDFTRYHIIVNGRESEPLNKRHAVRTMITELGRKGIAYETMAAVLFNRALRNVPGQITDPDALCEALATDHPTANPRSWFIEYPIIDTDNDRTWVIFRKWDGNTTKDALERLSTEFRDSGVQFRVEARTDNGTSEELNA